MFRNLAHWLTGRVFRLPAADNSVDDLLSHPKVQAALAKVKEEATADALNALLKAARR